MDYTYEKKDNIGNFETYEWDNTWIEHANEPDAKRILYIGDSICCGISRIMNHIPDKEIYFDVFGTSKGIDNVYFQDALRVFTGQGPARNVILFNNGLHGWHLNDDSEYDLYTCSAAHKHLLTGDGIHFQKEAYELFGQLIIKTLKENAVF